jgi:hypothetical protein
MATRTFDPWIGDRYRSEGIDGVRLLVLGESHYGPKSCEVPHYTCELVRLWGQQRRHRFYSSIQRLVVGGQGWLSSAERRAFWDRVAFYNFVQSLVGERPRERPTPEMWEAAHQPFEATIEELKPQVMLILGWQLHQNLPSLPGWLTVCAVPHPSSPGFRYLDWQQTVKAAFDKIHAEPGAAADPARTLVSGSS